MINIIIDTKRRCPGRAKVKNAARQTLELEKIKNNVSINLLFTDNKMIKSLNRRFLKRNAPTDVIAFGLNPAPPIKSNWISKRGWVKGFIGEVAISVEQAERNARRFNTSRENEILLYAIHGILHLLGYKDGTKHQMRIMEKRQGEILNAICASS